MKLTHIHDSPEALEYEADAYAALSGETGIPRVMWFGQEGDYYVLVHELLGPSLEDLFNYCGRKFSLKTVLLIADQAIRRLKQIHDNGYLHCDIKPDNFLLGTGNNGNILYTIDFGLARDFDATDGFGVQDNRPLGGTDRYASLNNHNRLSKSIFVRIAHAY
jgi:casein kinase 1 delta/casein kinase I family protein HRR25